MNSEERATEPEELSPEEPEELQPEPEELQPAQTSSARGIRYNDRVLVLGQTGTGKSVLINVLLSTGYRCQRLLVDTKDEFSVPGIEPVRAVHAIDWSEPIIHYIDASGDPDEYNDLFYACWQHRGGRGPATYGLVVCVHELSDLCGDQPGATPKWVNSYIRKGRGHGLGLLAGAQRPVNMPKVARTEAQHVFAFAPGFDSDDTPIVRKLLRLRNDAELEAAFEQAGHTGEHAYLWYDQRAQPRVVIRPPLPVWMLETSAVLGLEDYEEDDQEQDEEPEEDEYLEDE